MAGNQSTAMLTNNQQLTTNNQQLFLNGVNFGQDAIYGSLCKYAKIPIAQIPSTLTAIDFALVADKATLATF